jgi:hypothetical protein
MFLTARERRSFERTFLFKPSVHLAQQLIFATTDKFIIPSKIEDISDLPCVETNFD